MAKVRHTTEMDRPNTVAQSLVSDTDVSVPVAVTYLPIPSRNYLITSRRTANPG